MKRWAVVKQYEQSGELVWIASMQRFQTAQRCSMKRIVMQCWNRLEWTKESPSNNIPSALRVISAYGSSSWKSGARPSTTYCPKVCAWTATDAGNVIITPTHINEKATACLKELPYPCRVIRTPHCSCKQNTIHLSRHAIVPTELTYLRCKLFNNSTRLNSFKRNWLNSAGMF